MQRVTAAEAARALKVNRSTVSRWLQKNPALVDADGRVSVEELRRHREAVIDPRLQTNTAERAAEPAPAPAPERQAAPSINDHKARLERAKADEAELDLAERLGQTLVRADVERAIGEAGEQLRQDIAARVRDEAERLAQISDVREMELAVRKLFAEVVASSVEGLVDQMAGDAANAA